MVRFLTIVLAAAIISLPAASQNKGKSSTAPGQQGTSPGQQGTAPGSAPGYQTKGDLPGKGKDFAPGQDQKKALNPNK